MRRNRLHIGVLVKAYLAAGVIGVSSLGAFAAPVFAAKNDSNKETTTGEAIPAGEAVPAGEAIPAGEATPAGEAVSSDMISGTFTPSEISWKVQDSYEFPFMGLNFTLTDKLLKQMEDGKVAMLTDENWNEEGDAISYALFSWYTMTEEQRDAVIEKMGTGYDDWVKSLGKIGTLGVYSTDVTDQLDELTGCTEHTKLGESSDGKYEYYLSISKDADKKLKKELEKTKTELTDMAEFQQMSAFDQPIDMVQQDGDNVGKFEMTGIDKKTYTEDMFSEYDLTLVNVFTTWCSPCVNEIPELEKLYQELKDQGVGVTGVVLDTADSEGNQDEQAIKKAELLQEKTKATYPFLIPDENMMNGRLQGISAFPETFFVDKNGNIVGETYSGSHTLEEWKEIVEKELSAIKENN